MYLPSYYMPGKLLVAFKLYESRKSICEDMLEVHVDAKIYKFH